MEEEEEAQQKYYKSQTPHFFKIILHETLQTGKLNFPKSFVQHYGKSLCLSKLYLRVPSGDVWEVGLHREEDGGMWLHNGWQEFIEFYRIEFGCFLVFGYLGNSEFQVLIFDKTASEIEYPCKAKNEQEHDADANPCMLSVKPEIEEGDAEMVINHASCHINASNCIFSNNCEKNANFSQKISRDDVYVNGELTTKKSFRPYKPREKSEAIFRARAFNSPNPYFQIIMRPSYVCSKSNYLYMPGRFIMDHIGRKDCYAKLSLPCGRFWIVKCRFKMRSNQPEANVHVGWNSFVKDNNLVVGDVCVFELIDSAKVHFQVTIFRAAVDRSFSPYPETGGECTGGQIMPNPPSHEESSFDIQYAPTSNDTSKYPSFDLVITEARLKRHDMPIQRKFLKHLKRSTRAVTFQAAGRLWQVRVSFSRRDRKDAWFSHGWSKFARENFLQAGDVCVFELIKKTEMVLKVSIQKRSVSACHVI